MGGQYQLVVGAPTGRVLRDYKLTRLNTRSGDSLIVFEIYGHGTSECRVEN